LHHLHKAAQSAWNGISTEQLLEELRQIQQFVLLYRPQGEKGPNRVATVLSKQTLTRQALAKALGLDQLHITQRGQYPSACVSASQHNALSPCPRRLRSKLPRESDPSVPYVLCFQPGQILDGGQIPGARRPNAFNPFSQNSGAKDNL
jgi:hypothetical protein